LHGEGEKNGSQWFFKSPLYEVGSGFRGGDRMKTLSETQVKEHYDVPTVISVLISGLSLTSPPGPLSNTWRGGEKRILKSPLHAMGRGFRGGVNA